MKEVLGNVVPSGQPPSTNNSTLWKREQESLGAGSLLCHSTSLSCCSLCRCPWYLSLLFCWLLLLQLATSSSMFQKILPLLLCGMMFPWGSTSALLRDSHPGSDQIHCVRFSYCGVCQSASEKCVRAAFHLP